MKKIPIIFPSVINNVDKYESWEEWLEKTESALNKREYVKHKQNLKSETFSYWKTFYVNEKKAYQVALLFYDFRKFQKNFNIPDRIDVQFECIIFDTDDKFELSINKDITIEQFEIMATTFYDAMIQYC